MEKKRCSWVGDNKPHYQRYHDEEWGVPIHEDQKHFEMLILEGAQAGLTWETILKKREGYRRAFKNFNPLAVAQMTDEDLEQQRYNPEIIRHPLKIEAARKNAQIFLTIQKEFGTFDAYVWGMVGGKQKVNAWQTHQQIPATSVESDALSKDLKKRGMKFVGSTILYAYLQAAGMINDHTIDCWRYETCIK